jgi:hypothetical protein
VTAPRVTPQNRGSVHRPEPDRDAPGTCRVCHRPLRAKNDKHQPPQVDPAVQAEQARRLGERNTDE